MADPNALPAAGIRPFKSDDLPYVRYLIGASVLEFVARGNKIFLYQRGSLLVWAAISISAIVIFKLWPDFSSLGDENLVVKVPGFDIGPAAWKFMQYSRGMPPIAIIAILMLGVSEYRHRIRFDDEMKRVLGEEDMRMLEDYYEVGGKESESGNGNGQKGKKSKAKQQQSSAVEKTKSGFWVLEYDSRIIGCVALDGRKAHQPFLHSLEDDPNYDPKSKKFDGKSLSPSAGSLEQSPSANLRKRKPNQISNPSPRISITPPTPGPSSPGSTFASHQQRFIDSLDDPNLNLGKVVRIRRVTASLSFRPTGIETDLLQFALREAFTPSKTSYFDGETPVAADTVLFSFRPFLEPSLAKSVEQVGFVPCEPLRSSLGPKRIGKSGFWEALDNTLDRIWPLDLDTRQAWIIRREDWEKRSAKK